MVSSGRLLFLLLLCTVTVSAAPNPPEEVTPEKINKFKEVMKSTGKFVQNHAALIRAAVVPIVAFIPVGGQIISAVLVVALVGVEMSKKTTQVLDTLKSEFQSLNFKMEEYHIEQKWDSWASGAYHKPEEKIRTAWKTYVTFLSGLPQAKNDEQKKKLVKEFIKAYAQYEDATKTLHGYLTATGPTLMNNLAHDLAEHVKCHEKEIIEYTVLISQLMYMGSTMNQVYYGLKDTVTDPKVQAEAQMLYDSASAMFRIHKSCITDSIDYIKRDVEELMAGTEKKNLAKTVRSKLAEMYDRYDWMVVAFLTKKSKHKVVETENRHILFGFTEVTKDKVSVAVARQVKGTHSKQKANKVKEAIKRCFNKPALCYKVAQKLSKCKERVDDLSVSETYTAVHAFTRKSHDDHDTQEAPDEVFADPEESGNIPYIYTGKCDLTPSVKGGKFIVLIKSDEELKTKDPCTELSCGGKKRGECVAVKDLFIAMCECKDPYYGKNCEESLEDYKKSLKKRSITIDDKGEVFLHIDVSDSPKRA